MPIALFHSRKPSGLGGNPARGETQSEKELALAFLEWIQKKVLIWEKLQWVQRCPLEQIIDIGGAMKDKLFYLEGGVDSFCHKIEIYRNVIKN